jgi:hypothetical protein
VTVCDCSDLNPSNAHAACSKVVAGAKYTAAECFAQILAGHLSDGREAGAFVWRMYATAVPSRLPARKSDGTGHAGALMKPFRLSFTNQEALVDILRRACFDTATFQNASYRSYRQTLIGKGRLAGFRLAARPGIRLQCEGLGAHKVYYTREECATRLTLTAEVAGRAWDTLVFRADEAGARRRSVQKEVRRVARDRKARKRARRDRHGAFGLRTLDKPGSVDDRFVEQDDDCVAIDVAPVPPSETAGDLKASKPASLPADNSSREEQLTGAGANRHTLR